MEQQKNLNTKKYHKYEFQSQIYPVCKYFNILEYESLFNVVFKDWPHPTIIKAREPMRGQLKMNN